MQFIRAEFRIITPVVHNNQFISGHYLLRYLEHSSNALGTIVDRIKWEKCDKSDFFAPYTVPARFHFEYQNGLSRASSNYSSSLFFQCRKIYGNENKIIIDILDPTPEEIKEFQEIIKIIPEFQFGAKETNGNGVCHYEAADIYQYDCSAPTSPNFMIEFMSDFIPRKRLTAEDLTKFLQSLIPVSLPPDYELTYRSLPTFEEKQYWIKKNMEFQVVPQFFLMHLETNHPEYNHYLAQAGLKGIGQLPSAGFGKFRLNSSEKSPLHFHSSHAPPILQFSEEEKQFLKAALLHDLIPKVGGIEVLNKYYELNQDLSGLLLLLHHEWHNLRETTTIRLTDFLRQIEAQYSKTVMQLYYKLTLADQLAARMTRVKRIPTFSRYLIGHDTTQKIDFLGLATTLLPIDSPFKLWKAILKSPELATLNESLFYGDQPLSTHLLLTLNFGIHLMRGKPAYILAKVVPRSEKRFIQDFWYKIFNITQNNEVNIYSIEELIPQYPVALVEKVLVKSLRPETGWLRIQ